MDADDKRIAEIEALFEANGWQLHLDEVDGVWEATCGINEVTIGQMLPAPYGRALPVLRLPRTPGRRARKSLGSAPTTARHRNRVSPGLTRSASRRCAGAGWRDADLRVVRDHQQRLAVIREKREVGWSAQVVVPLGLKVCDMLFTIRPRGAHGKEGVNSSNLSEGFVC